jgi:hypothetical protein
MSSTDEHGCDVPPRRPSSDECTVQGGYIGDDGTIEGKEHYAAISPDFPDGGLGAWLVLSGVSTPQLAGSTEADVLTHS